MEQGIVTPAHLVALVFLCILVIVIAILQYAFAMFGNETKLNSQMRMSSRDQLLIMLRGFELSENASDLEISAVVRAINEAALNDGLILPKRDDDVETIVKIQFVISINILARKAGIIEY